MVVLYYFEYPKLLFSISKIIISDIRNKCFSNYPKFLFWLSEISILDIQNNYFGYEKMNRA